MRYKWLCVILPAIVASSCGGSSDSSTDSEIAKPLNIVVVLTDDQRWDTLAEMPLLLDRIAQHGVKFNNAYATTPVCAPFRASFLSGGYYAHDTHVKSNYDFNGHWEAYPELNTLAERMQQSGYKTGFVGKYINGYNAMFSNAEAIIPPGWDYFIADDIQRKPTINWYESFYIEADKTMSGPGFVRGKSFEYITDFQSAKAVSFVNRYAANPFFLMLAYRAPHGPATDAQQAPQDVTAFQDFVYRGRGWGEQDTADKSAITRLLEMPVFIQSGGYDEFTRGQLRLLQAADRGIESLMQALEDQGVLNDTVVFFLSDNGFLWGEHNITGKGNAFEESARVPLVAIYPKQSAGERDGLVAANLDVPATILEIAGAQPAGDGISLWKAIQGDALTTRTQVLMENWELGGGEPYIWSAALIKDGQGSLKKLIEFQTGEREFYDLDNDPYELLSAPEDPTSQVEIEQLADQLEKFKTIAILDNSLPAAITGTYYEYQLRWWGSDETPQFQLSSGNLPAGISLQSTGLISGIPLAAGEFSVAITVSGSATSKIDGKPLSHSGQFVFTVDE